MLKCWTKRLKLRNKLTYLCIRAISNWVLAALVLLCWALGLAFKPVRCHKSMRYNGCLVCSVYLCLPALHPTKCIYFEFLLLSFGLDCSFSQCEYLSFGFATLKWKALADLTDSFVSWCAVIAINLWEENLFYQKYQHTLKASLFQKKVWNMVLFLLCKRGFWKTQIANSRE